MAAAGSRAAAHALPSVAAAIRAAASGPASAAAAVGHAPSAYQRPGPTPAELAASDASSDVVRQAYTRAYGRDRTPLYCAWHALSDAMSVAYAELCALRSACDEYGADKERAAAAAKRKADAVARVGAAAAAAADAKRDADRRAFDAAFAAAHPEYAQRGAAMAVERRADEATVAARTGPPHADGRAVRVLCVALFADQNGQRPMHDTTDEDAYEGEGYASYELWREACAAEAHEYDMCGDDTHVDRDTDDDAGGEPASAVATVLPLTARRFRAHRDRMWTAVINGFSAADTANVDSAQILRARMRVLRDAVNARAQEVLTAQDERARARDARRAQRAAVTRAAADAVKPIVNPLLTSNAAAVAAASVSPTGLLPAPSQPHATSSFDDFSDDDDLRELGDLGGHLGAAAAALPVAAAGSVPPAKRPAASAAGAGIDARVGAGAPSDAGFAAGAAPAAGGRVILKARRTEKKW